jgi:hypothetical protein
MELHDEIDRAASLDGAMQTGRHVFVGGNLESLHPDWFGLRQSRYISAHFNAFQVANTVLISGLHHVGQGLC